MYWMSSTPIWLDQKPVAVMSRNSLKNVAGSVNLSGPLRPGDVVEHLASLALGRFDERLPEARADSVSSHASPPRIRSRLSHLLGEQKSMNSGTPASVALARARRRER